MLVRLDHRIHWRHKWGAGWSHLRERRRTETVRMCECSKIKALWLKSSRIDKQQIQSQNHGQLSPISEEIVNASVSISKKWPRSLTNVSKKLEGSASPKSQNGRQNHLITASNEKFEAIIDFYLRIACWKSRRLLWLRFGVFRTDLRNRLDSKIPNVKGWK